MSRGRATALAVVILLALLALAGCGAGGLTPAQVRVRATAICDGATDRTAGIRLPSAPSGAQHFLTQGIAAVAPEVRGLRALGDHGALRVATRAMQGELAALRSSLKGLRAGNDPVVAIKTLQQQLIALELQANTAWRTLKLTACVSR